MATDLDTVFTSAGIDNIHFFNGRVLTAEDLRGLATADAEHRRRLGRCIGEGIAQGMRVTALGGRLVRVGAGLAVSSLGDVVDLPVDVDVDLGSPALSDPGPDRDPLFHECAGSASDPLGIGGAVYVLTVRPAARLTGEAPAATADETGSSCGPRFSREGVRFRRVLVDLERLVAATGVPTGSLSLATPAGADVVRSLTAHLFLGTPWLLARLTDVLGPHLLRDAWTRTRLEACEVPAALVGMRGAEVAFVDEWGVRRSPVRLPPPPEQPAAGGAPAPTGPRTSTGFEYLLGADRRQEGLATVLQFQDQLAKALVPGQPLRAREHFSFLPAVGLLPAVPELVAEAPDGGGLVFFTGLGHRTGLSIAADQVEAAVRTGAQAPPVDVRFAPGRLLVFDVEGTASPVKLFVSQGHPLAVESDLVDLRERLLALQTRVEALESDDESPAGVLVRPPKLPVVVREGDTVEVRFTVLAGTAGEYRVDPPTLALRSLVQVPGLTVALSGPATFTTTGRELREVSVTVVWRRRKLVAGGGVLAPKEFAGRELPGTTVPLLPRGGGVLLPGIGDPAGTRAGAVRLRVEGPEDTSDVADAPIVLAT